MATIGRPPLRGANLSLANAASLDGSLLLDKLKALAEASNNSSEAAPTLTESIYQKRSAPSSRAGSRSGSRAGSRKGSSAGLISAIASASAALEAQAAEVGAVGVAAPAAEHTPLRGTSRVFGNTPRTPFTPDAETSASRLDWSTAGTPSMYTSAMLPSSPPPAHHLPMSPPPMVSGRESFVPAEAAALSATPMFSELGVEADTAVTAAGTTVNVSAMLPFSPVGAHALPMSPPVMAPAFASPIAPRMGEVIQASDEAAVEQGVACTTPAAPTHFAADRVIAVIEEPETLDAVVAPAPSPTKAVSWHPSSHLMTVAIVSTAVENEGTFAAFTSYGVQVSVGGGDAPSTACNRRYREFVAFRTQAIQHCKAAGAMKEHKLLSAAPFPPKALAPLRASIVAARQHGLVEFMCVAAKVAVSVPVVQQTMAQFCGLEQEL